MARDFMRDRLGLEPPIAERDRHPIPGKRALTDSLEGPPSVQLQREAGADHQAPDAHRIATAGVQSASDPLPHLATIQTSFGRHDVGGVRAHVGGPAAEASASLGASAYAYGDRVGFAAAPDLHTAAHEAAHVVQQRAGVSLKGGVGEAGDPWERHADAVADEVVAGRSAESLLDRQPTGGGASAAVQRAPAEPQDARAAPAEGTRSRITVASAVNANRATYPDDKTGGMLTHALLLQLRDRRVSVADAADKAGDGTHQFGTPGSPGEERGGVNAGASTAAGSVTRRALVVVNAQYDETKTMGNTVENSRDLPGGARDGVGVTAALKPRGYATTARPNLTGAQIDAELRSQLSGLGAGSELVFFYTGHGTMEGLIGVDGSVFTPAQAGGIRNLARQNQVDFVMVLDGCHSGIFVDFMRGRELADTRAGLVAGAAAGAAAAAPGSPQPSGDLVALLDEAIATQTERDRYNATMQLWWARRYEIEKAMNEQLTAGNTSDDVSLPWETHMVIQRDHFNALAAAANPHLAGIAMLRTSLLLSGAGALQLRAVARDASQEVDNDIQGQLDDMDIVLNSVLDAADAALGPKR